VGGKGREVNAEPVCPDCGTALREIGTHGEYVCPVALEAKRRGLLGQPGRKHKAATVWTRDALEKRKEGDQ
jgi:uncharacterized Zn finger protein (UPF0148 family)